MWLHLTLLQRPPKQVTMVCAQTQLFQYPIITWVPWASFRSAVFTLKAIVRLFDFKTAKSQVLQSAFTANLCFPAVYIHTETQTYHYLSSTT